MHGRNTGIGDSGFTVGREASLGIDAAQPLGQLRQILSSDGQKLQRFRQRKEHSERDEHGHSSAEIEDRAPAKRGNQPGGNEAAHGCARSEAT
jgi:hypothetical protein